MQIGEQLKEARELKDLTLDDIQAMTKIQKRYLVAIENEDFHALPGRFYARAFIKEYANAVDLNPDELLASFDEEKIENKEEETVQYSRMKRPRGRGTDKGTSILSFLPSVIVVLLIASILIVAWTLYQKSLSKPAGDSVEEQETDEIIQRQPEESAPITHEEVEEDDPEDDMQIEDEEQGGTFTVVQTGTGNSPESTVKYTTNRESITVQLKATEDSYVQIKSENGMTHIDRLFTVGMEEELELSTGNRIYFNIGHAPGMSILINGDTLQFPVDPNQSVHQKIWLEFN